MTSNAIERAPLWWYKWWAALARVVCESLFILDIPAPTTKCRDEWGNVAQVWCGFVHSPFESASYQREVETANEVPTMTSWRRTS